MMKALSLCGESTTALQESGKSPIPLPPLSTPRRIDIILNEPEGAGAFLVEDQIALESETGFF